MTPCHRVASVVGWGLAFAVVWFALLGPTAPRQLTPTTFLRLPLEAIAVVAIMVVAAGLTASRRATRLGLALLIGVPLGLLAVFKVLCLASFAVLDRKFNPVSDVAQLGPAVDFVRTSFGSVAVAGASVAVVLGTATLLLGPPLLVARVTRLVQRRPRRAGVAVLALTTVWVALALAGLRVAPQQPVAAVDASRLVLREAGDISSALAARRAFDAALRVDAYREPRTGDLSGLAGKDVLVVFVESYGRVAVEGAAAGGVRALLDADSRQLKAAGYGARSAFLTSPTFGGVSWLAHSTLQSGVWVDSQSSYERLLSGDRNSLTSVFRRAGWRTVALLPANRGAWPEGRAYYGFDTIYDSSSLGYAGPPFGFSMMPDQFALRAFQRLELGPGRRQPVMAEIDLASSHGPWAPVPTMLGWDGLGDGSVFDQMHQGAETYAELWQHLDRVPAAYMASIEYSLTALVSFVERYGGDNLVLVVVGDHQPATIVSGSAANRDVPVSVLAHDPRVLAQVAGWGWQDGLRPSPQAPVWRMDAFRDRFLGAFSSRSGPMTTTTPEASTTTVPRAPAAFPSAAPDPAGPSAP